MRHAFVHFELNSSVPAEARRFYEALFDWSFVDVEVGDATYTQIRTPSGLGGGLQPNPEPGMPSRWVPFVGVPDVRAALSEAKRAGGEVVVEYTPVPGFGALAIVQDPGGTQIGLWEVADAPAEATDESAAEPEPEVLAEEVAAQEAEAAAKKEAAAKRRAGVQA